MLAHHVFHNDFHVFRRKLVEPVVDYMLHLVEKGLCEIRISSAYFVVVGEICDDIFQFFSDWIKSGGGKSAFRDAIVGTLRPAGGLSLLQKSKS